MESGKHCISKPFKRGWLGVFAALVDGKGDDISSQKALSQTIKILEHLGF